MPNQINLMTNSSAIDVESDGNYLSELEQEVLNEANQQTISFMELSRELGVSDNAIRKYINKII